MIKRIFLEIIMFILKISNKTSPKLNKNKKGLKKMCGHIDGSITAELSKNNITSSGKQNTFFQKSRLHAFTKSVMNPVTLELCKRIQAHMNQKYNISTLTVPHAWMEGCVTWYYAENNRRPSLDPNAVLQVLQFVTKQWLMVDFVELKLKSLPPDLGNLKVTNLSGNFLVQVAAS